jgi:hypothetical protein
MSETPRSPSAGDQPTLTPLLRALKTRDHEGLSKLRHALRTPLNQIIGYSELLMEGAAETGATALVPELKRIHSSGGELLALINEALAGWKIEAGKVDFPALREDMRAPLSNVITLSNQAIERARATGQAPAIKDLEKIHQAAQNLLTLAENSHAIESAEPAAAPAADTSPPLSTLGAQLLGAADSPHDFGLSAQPIPTARILAVDDDNLNREILVRRLEKLGY